jgi:enoyl-CoA hydratase/carnithine racemase
VLGATRRLRGVAPTLHLVMQMMATYFAIENCRKITIAAINGSCNGGGTELGACFDFRFMVDDAGFRIGQPEVLLGILAGGGGTQRVTRLIGTARALEFMLVCDQWTPQQAKTAGLITGHFPKAAFVQQVQAFADRMSRRSLVACQATRHAIHRGSDTDVSRGLTIEMAGFPRCIDDPGTQAALTEYAHYLDGEVIGKPDAPADISRILETVEGEGYTRHFQQVCWRPDATASELISQPPRCSAAPIRVSDRTVRAAVPGTACGRAPHASPV